MFHSQAEIIMLKANFLTKDTATFIVVQIVAFTGFFLISLTNLISLKWHFVMFNFLFDCILYLVTNIMYITFVTLLSVVNACFYNICLLKLVIKTELNCSVRQF